MKKGEEISIRRCTYSLTATLFVCSNHITESGLKPQFKILVSPLFKKKNDLNNDTE